MATRGREIEQDVAEIRAGRHGSPRVVDEGRDDASRIQTLYEAYVVDGGDAASDVSLSTELLDAGIQWLSSQTYDTGVGVYSLARLRGPSPQSSGLWLVQQGHGRWYPVYSQARLERRGGDVGTGPAPASGQVRPPRRPRRAVPRVPRSASLPGSSSAVLGVTASGKDVPRPSRGAPDTNNIEIFRRTRERFPGWGRADHMDAAILLGEAAETADASGYRTLAERYRRWQSVHWDLGGRWLARDLEERAAARRSRLET